MSSGTYFFVDEEDFLVHLIQSCACCALPTPLDNKRPHLLAFEKFYIFPTGSFRSFLRDYFCPEVGGSLERESVC